MSRKRSVGKALKHRHKKRRYPDWVYENLKKYGIKMSTFKNRVNTLMWPMDKASTTPPIKNNKDHPWHETNDVFYIKE